MASYQDIDVRLRVVEDKIEFAMKTLALTSRYRHPLVPEQIVQETKSLLDLYRQMKGLGMNPDQVVSEPAPTEPTSEPEQING